MKKLILTVLLILGIATASLAADKAECHQIWTNESISAGGSSESSPIALSGNASQSVTSEWRVNSGGVLNIQPYISAGSGTITLQVAWSNFSDPDNHWSDWETVDAGITSSNDLQRYPLDPNGTALWVKFKVTETGGSSSATVSVALCSN